MSNEAEKEPGAVFKYEDTEVFKVDIVGGPATKDKFMIIRGEEDGKPKRRAMTKQAIKALSNNDSEGTSVPMVARQEVVEAAVETESDSEPSPEEKTDRVLPSEVEGETESPVERTEEEPENISEETQMSVKKLTEAVTALSGLVERMEGSFSNVLGVAAGTQADEDTPAPEEAPKAETEPSEAPEPEEAPKAETEPGQTPAPEEAPETASVATEPVASAPAPAPVETPEEAPVASDPAPVEAGADISEAVTNLTSVVERMGNTVNNGFEALNTKVDGMTSRVDKVERSVLSGGNADQDETEGPIERSESPKTGLFSNIFHG